MMESAAWLVLTLVGIGLVGIGVLTIVSAVGMLVSNPWLFIPAVAGALLLLIGAVSIFAGIAGMSGKA